MIGRNAHGVVAAAGWLGTVRELSPAELHHLHGDAHRTEGADRGAIVLGYFLRGQLCGIARIVPLKPGAGRRAEVRLTVEQPWQSCGIGTMLMAGLLHHARRCGVNDLYLRCHALNSRMQKIAQRFGARIGFEDCECFAHIALAGTVSCQ